MQNVAGPGSRSQPPSEGRDEDNAKAHFANVNILQSHLSSTKLLSYLPQPQIDSPHEEFHIFIWQHPLIRVHIRLDAMAAATYSVSQTTLYGPNGAGPDPGKVYGVLFSTGSSVDWPTALTSLSFPDGPVLTSISATSESLFNTNNEFSTIRALGRLYSDGNPVPWPTTAMGLYTDAPATAVSNSASSSTTATATSTTTTNTSVTSKASTSAAGSSGTSASKHPTPTSQPSSSHSSGLPTGAIAGIAIGCALAGLVVGLVAAFCFFRRKGQRRRSVDHVVLHHEPKTYVTDDATVTHDLQLKQFMLEATPDRDIVQETESIGALIEQHVETYYHAEPLRADTRILVSALMQLGFSTSNSPASLDAQHATALCIHPRSRQVGLRHVIMRVLFSNIDTKSPHSPSLLPAPVASFIRAIPSAENDRLNDSQGKKSPQHRWASRLSQEYGFCF